jgi:hypothetical protein
MTNLPFFVETSEGYIINVALVRWIKIDKAMNEVRFVFTDTDTENDWVDVPLTEGLNIIGKMGHLMIT